MPLWIFVFFIFSIGCQAPGGGPLRVCPENPRYFCDGNGQVIYLTGSHTWNNLVDMSSDSSPAFDFEAYLEWMESYNHNFIRLWAWELLNWDTRGNREDDAKVHFVSPHPWARTGPGKAFDGLPKFDLDRFDEEYFRRLRNRISAAQKRGIYVSVMLFEGWGMQFSPDAWRNHPFHPDNNINGIDGDVNGDGMGLEIHTLVDSQITALQESYVTKVIDTVNDFDNVLYEISNENHPPSTPWQYHMIRYIKAVEKNRKNQHPVGMTFQYRGGSNETLFKSPADWISPNAEGGYRDDPPAADGRKVVITDTDHLWGIGGNHKWVWKSFTRGMNVLFMDPYDGLVLKKSYDPEWAEPLRKSLGYARAYALRMNLIDMKPENLASSHYCLANRGEEYLVYLPDSTHVQVDLKDVTGSVEVEWFDPVTGDRIEGEPVAGGTACTFESPFESEDAVLYLKRI